MTYQLKVAWKSEAEKVQNEAPCTNLGWTFQKNMPNHLYRVHTYSSVCVCVRLCFYGGIKTKRNLFIFNSYIHRDTIQDLDSFLQWCHALPACFLLPGASFCASCFRNCACCFRNCESSLSESWTVSPQAVKRSKMTLPLVPQCSPFTWSGWNGGRRIHVQLNILSAYCIPIYSIPIQNWSKLVRLPASQAESLCFSRSPCNLVGNKIGRSFISDRLPKSLDCITST